MDIWGGRDGTNGKIAHMCFFCRRAHAVKFDSSDGPCWRNMKWLVWALKVNEGLTGLGLNGTLARSRATRL
eukprot:2944945-Pleurochrysis_carterae.AAC.1